MCSALLRGHPCPPILEGPDGGMVQGKGGGRDRVGWEAGRCQEALLTVLDVALTQNKNGRDIRTPELTYNGGYAGQCAAMYGTFRLTSPLA